MKHPSGGIKKFTAYCSIWFQSKWIVLIQISWCSVSLGYFCCPQQTFLWVDKSIPESTVWSYLSHSSELFRCEGGSYAAGSQNTYYSIFTKISSQFALYFTNAYMTNL